MTSRLNSSKGNSSTFTGSWECVELYACVRILFTSSNPTSTLTLNWSNNNSNTIPTTEDFSEIIEQVASGSSIVRDTRGAWFRVKFSNLSIVDYNISTLYQEDNAIVRIKDSNHNLVSVQNGAMNVAVGSGLINMLSSTSTQITENNTGLCTNFTDANGALLNTIGNDDKKSLGVTLCDASYGDIINTGSAGDVDYISMHPTDISGISQGSTPYVENAFLEGVALNVVLPISSTSFNLTLKNSLYCSLIDNEGIKTGTSVNPLPLYALARDISYSLSFDSSGGIDNSFTPVKTSSYLHSLNLYNENQQYSSCWINLYDSSGSVDQIVESALLSIPIHQNSTRDLVFTKPITFKNGITMLSRDFPYGAPVESIFATGVYSVN